MERKPLLFFRVYTWKILTTVKHLE